jgi:hypothetical protein
MPVQQVSRCSATGTGKEKQLTSTHLTLVSGYIESMAKRMPREVLEYLQSLGQKYGKLGGKTAAKNMTAAERKLAPRKHHWRQPSSAHLSVLRGKTLNGRPEGENVRHVRLNPQIHRPHSL